MKRENLLLVLLLVVVLVVAAVLMAFPRGGTLQIVVGNFASGSETMIVTVDGRDIYNQVTPFGADVALTLRVGWFGLLSGCPIHTITAFRPQSVGLVSDSKTVGVCDGQVVKVMLTA